MKLKAMLLCEDVRFEVGGTVTLVGVFNERLIAPPGVGRIQIAFDRWCEDDLSGHPGCVLSA